MVKKKFTIKIEYPGELKFSNNTYNKKNRIQYFLITFPWYALHQIQSWILHVHLPNNNIPFCLSF